MNKTGSRLTGTGVAAVVAWIWNVVIPYFLGVGQGWPEMTAEVGVVFGAAVIALVDRLLTTTAVEQ